jgi:hypothetical protein
LSPPLDANGRIDPELWRGYREHCGVRRFGESEDDEFGPLVHSPGGAQHARWLFDYDETTQDDDEAGYRFGDRVSKRGIRSRSTAKTVRSIPSAVVSVEPGT